jgi:5-(carboxyamino)imidazole ribonucleotide synthase
VLQIPNVFVHIYGKAETKVERKMGHITVYDHTLKKALAKAKKARKGLSI